MPTFTARAFPSAPSDLNLALRPDDPASVTALLWQCLRLETGEPVPVESLWSLQIGERIAWLLRIATRSGARTLAVAPRCSAPPCREAVQIELPIEGLIGLWAQDPGTITLELHGRTVLARRPTGADQRAWAHTAFTTLHEAVRVAAASLLLGEDSATPTDDELRALEDALELNDPLCHFAVSAACPHCGVHTTHQIDLAALTMEWLDGARAATIEMVHALARSYHWSEAEIFAIAPWRRARYLALVERDDRIRR